MSVKIFILLTLSLLAVYIFRVNNIDVSYTTPRDLYSDTWVATDEIGRDMPSQAEVGNLKTDKDRTVGIFYVTWHRENKKKAESPYTADVSKILNEYPEARLDGNHPAWQKGYHHWAEPEMGYFLSTDKWVIRHDMSMLADAGVDVLIMDATNAVLYWEEWETTFSVMQEMAKEGNKVPKFCFWAFNGPVISVVQQLYEKIYKIDKYKDLWFYWEDKPLMLWNNNPMQDATSNTKNKNINANFDSLAITDVNHPHYGDVDYTQKYYTDYTQEVKTFFTTRMMWWGYHSWKGQRYVGKEGNWSFGYDLGHPKVKNLPADSLVAPYKGKVEQAAVTPAQHSHSYIGKSWTREKGEPQLNEQDMPVKAYVPWLGKEVDNPSAYGIYFQERWDEAIASDPAFLYINDWNEWTAIKFAPDQVKVNTTDGKATFMKRQSNFLFIDQYNAEFNRGIQPMKDGYTDNYYMQMAQNIRRYKGVRSIPVLDKVSAISIDGKFEDWKSIETEYRDTKGDVTHRNHKGYGNLWYTNTSGRNDIVTAKIAANKKAVSFYVETSHPLSDHTDAMWMILLIDIDKNTNTGWNGYDFMVKDYSAKACLYKYENDQWYDQEKLDFAFTNNKLEISVPLFAMHLSTSEFSFDFKWADNPKDLSKLESLFNDGDTAPNRRFNYRCIYKQRQ